MGLIDLFLPERLPRQVVFAADRHAEIVQLQHGRAAASARLEGVPLAEGGERDWEGLLGRLQAADTGVVFNASPFIYNFFEFDKLPWQEKSLRALVTWRLQKIFPEDIAAYDHRFYRLDRKRVLSILVRRSLLETVERRFREKRLRLTFLGNSTMVILARMLAAKPAPDFFIENDRATCAMAFDFRRSPIYIRRFQGGPPLDTAGEVEKTVAFVRSQYKVSPQSYWLVDHQDAGLAEAAEARLSVAGLSRLKSGPAPLPHIPGRP